MKPEPVVAGDFEAISTLLVTAFGSSTCEASLISSLRIARRPLLEWVIRDHECITAYVAFTLAYRSFQTIGFHLAPVAVLPGNQRKGFGTALIGHALLDPRLASSSIFVLGSPHFYSRFGFEHVERPLCPFDPGNAHFQALRWSSQDLFSIGYEPEFTNA
jgi:putative acetyltransferase